MKRANPPPRPSNRAVLRKTQPWALHHHSPAGAKLSRKAAERKL